MFCIPRIFIVLLDKALGWWNGVRYIMIISVQANAKNNNNDTLFPLRVSNCDIVMEQMIFVFSPVHGRRNMLK